MAGSAPKEAAFNLDDEAFSSDHFRMYEFKVKRCPQARPHDWTRCPFAHPGEKAKRRDPRKFQYSGTACPEFRKSGCCRRGDACPFAHGVFECWCHPSRYRTQICTDGTNCKRRVCFFAHLESEVRNPEDNNVQLTSQMQAELVAEAQYQQQEVAQAFQVLMNANAQNPGSLANLNFMNSLGMMNPGNQVPINPLAERAQQLQAQLQQLQALQASQELHNFDAANAGLLAAQGGQAPGQQHMQAHLDRELMLSSAPPASMMPSPFARQPLGAFGRQQHRIGTPPLMGDQMSHASQLSLSMSLPNPDALQQAGISPGGIGSLPGGRQSGSLLGGSAFGGMNGGAFSGAGHFSALNMQRHASLDQALPAAAGHYHMPAERTASGTLGLPGSHLFAHAGSQPIGPASSHLQIPGQAGSDSQAFDRSGFHAMSNGQPFMSSPQQQHLQAHHGHRRSVDIGSINRQGSGRLADVPLSDAPSMGSQPSASLLGDNASLNVDMQQSPLGLDMLSSLSLGDRTASGGWPPVSQPGRGNPSQTGAAGLSLSSAASLPAVGARHLPSRLGLGLPLPAASNAAAAAAAAFAATADSQPMTMMPVGTESAGTATARLNSLQGDALPPTPASSAAPGKSSQLLSGVPMGPSAAAAIAARSLEAFTNAGNDAVARPPAIQEGQQLVGVASLLPRTPPSGTSHIGRNASFDSILAELPRSLSEVHMQAAAAQQPGHDGTIQFNTESADRNQ